jgi:transposase-like protein
MPKMAGKTPRKRRARLTSDEQRHIVGLYADPQVSTADIRRRFAISDTSLYRLLQKQGVPLRGRSTSRTSRVRARSTGPAASSDAKTTREFRIEFRAERIVLANSVQDALMQTLHGGASDVSAIVQSA